MDKFRENTFYIPETTSTNNLLWEMLRKKDYPEGFIIYTDYQTSGRGQAGNSWESERGKNLLFSMLLKPVHIEISENFHLSQIVSVGIKRALSACANGITIKWANDIYWNDKKLAGMLIENSLQAGVMKQSVIGIGINVNQDTFHNAPNPVSLKNITGETFILFKLMAQIHENIMIAYQEKKKELQTEYTNSLYRKEGFHLYEDENGKFEAEIKNIQPDGRLDLLTRENEVRNYYFKEVKFII